VSKLLLAKLWMGIVYTTLATILLTLVSLLVWGCITDPDIAKPFIWFGCLVAVYLIFAGLVILTKWANKTIEESK
jgi:hypothetical protein